jgi:hypothetical protein
MDNDSIMLSFSDITELEESFKNTDSIIFIKSLLYVFTGIIVLYIIIDST